MPVEVRAYQPDLTTLIGTIDQAYEIQWERMEYETGSGEFTVPHDSPFVQANPSVLTRGTVFRVFEDAQARFGWLLERRARQRGDVWDPVTVVGRGLTALLEEALVLPLNWPNPLIDSDERVFSWKTQDYDETVGWAQIAGAMIGEKLSTPGWPDDQAVGFEMGHTSDDDVSYVRRLMPSNVSVAGPARFHVVATWRTEVVVFVDGVEALRKERGATGVHFVDLEYQEYAQQVSVEIRGGDGRWGASWIRLEEPASLNEEPEYGSVLRRTYDPAEFPAADTPWLYWTGAEYPGVTPGFVLLTLLGEATARGLLSELVPTFTADVDTNNKVWQRISEFALTAGNDNILTVAERMSDLEVDVEVDADLNFHSWWVRGEDRTATVELGLQSVLELAAEVEDLTANALVARTQAGWLSKGNVVGRRRESFVSLALNPSNEGAEPTVEALLEEMQTSRMFLQATAPSDLNLSVLGGDYDTGDEIIAPGLPTGFVGPWALTSGRVVGFGSAVSPTGERETVVMYSSEIGGAG